jgi:hypothetical protein
MIFVKYQNRKWGSLLIIVSMVTETWNIKAFYQHIRYRLHLSPLVKRSIVQTAPLGVGKEVVDCPHDVKNNWQDGRHIWQTQK